MTCAKDGYDQQYFHQQKQQKVTWFMYGIQILIYPLSGDNYQFFNGMMVLHIGKAILDEIFVNRVNNFFWKNDFF